MRRCLPILLLATACSSSKSSGPAPSPAIQKIANLVPEGVTTVARFGPKNPMIDMFGKLGGDKTPCWGTLVAKLTASYSFTNKVRDTSLIILEGDLPRRDVEACVELAMKESPIPIKIEKDGDYTVFVQQSAEAGEASKGYAAWKDGLVLIGSKSAVIDAMTGPRSKDPWGARIARLPAAAMAAASVEPLTTTLVGIPTQGYDLVLDSMEKPVRGRLIVHANAAADAKTIATKLAAGDIKWPAKPSAKLDEALRKMPVKVVGDDVEISVDESAFAGIDPADLDRLGKSIIGGKPDDADAPRRNADVKGVKISPECMDNPLAKGC